MNFDLTDTQAAVRDLAEQVFAGEVTQDRLKAAERSGQPDAALWAALGGAGLVGLSLPEPVGGGGLGLVELALVLEQQGRFTAPVPLLATAVTAAAVAPTHPDLAAAAADDAMVLTAALAEPGANDALRPSVVALLDGERVSLHGWKPVVPYAQQAARILVPARVDDASGVFVVDPTTAGVALEPLATTNHEPQANVTLDAAEASWAGDAATLERLLHSTLVGLCALQVGVCEAALAATAEYVTGRQQFGKPLATFQAVAQQAADGYVAVEAMRVTMLQAAWRLDQGLDARREVLVAKYWASEAGQRVVHIAQHLHGGMGADVDYPVHRHFLWGIQIDTALGGAGQQLARLGLLLAGR